MERESSSCYTVDEKLDTLKNDPDSQWKVKEVLYPALRLAETAYDEFIKSVVLKRRNTDRLPHGEVVYHNWHLRCSVEPTEQTIQSLIEEKYGCFAEGIVAEGLANYVYDKTKFVLRSAGNAADIVLCTVIPRRIDDSPKERTLGLRRVDIKIFAERHTGPPVKELIGNYVVISFVISEIASKDVKYDNLQSIARFHWAGLPDEKQRGLYKMLEEGWRNELTAQGLWPLTGREADNHPSDVARWLERSDG